MGTIRSSENSTLVSGRERQVLTVGKDSHTLKCEAPSTAGAVSQRACVFCGSRVVLYPIADALHLIHGPVGCAAYTWDIRGPGVPVLNFTGSVSAPTCGKKRSFSEEWISSKQLWTSLFPGINPRLPLCMQPVLWGLSVMM